MNVRSTMPLRASSWLNATAYQPDGNDEKGKRGIAWIDCYHTDQSSGSAILNAFAFTHSAAEMLADALSL